MPTVQDFIVISERPVRVGDTAPGPDREEREITFSVSDIDTSQPAILHFEVRGLTVANEDPDVEINNREIGKINRYFMQNKGKDGESNFWFHQSMVVPRNAVSRGRNTLEIKAPSWKHANTKDRFDDFDIRNIVLFYKTET